MPYRDFAVQYPPGALGVFVAATYVGNPAKLRSYERSFGWLMGLLGLCTVLLVASAFPPSWGLALVACLPLLAGSLASERFDLWPTALTTAAVVAFLRDRHRIGWAALATAFATKLYPLALVPLAAVWTFRRRGSAVLARALAVALAVIAAAFGPFVVLAPHGLWASVWGRASRPLQIESLAASLLMTSERPRVIRTYHTLGIAGHGTLATISFAAQLGALLVIWLAFARGEASSERFLRYAAAAVCAFVAFGRVFSPQYLIWLVPPVALVGGRRGIAGFSLLVAAFIGTDLWYGTSRFAHYAASGQWAWLVLIRNLTVIALVAVFSLPTRWRSGTRTPALVGRSPNQPWMPRSSPQERRWRFPISRRRRLWLAGPSNEDLVAREVGRSIGSTIRRPQRRSQ